jgi:hypothetical protein
MTGRCKLMLSPGLLPCVLLIQAGAPARVQVSQAPSDVRATRQAETEQSQGGETVESPARERSRSLSPQQELRASALLLLVGFLLLLVFLVATYLLVRVGRRIRDNASRQRPPPTDVTDVWSMHKAPEFDEADFEFKPGEDDAD